MTEVPEHLLQRSRERRAALGGGSAAPSAPAGGSGGGDDDGGASAAAPVPAAAAAAAPVVAEPAPPPPPPPPYVQAALERKKMPPWMAGAGVLTLLWAFVYAGVLFAPGDAAIADPVLAEGQEIYAGQCAGCHGGSGQGGTGRPLAGEVYLTFPNIEDHIAWIREGSPTAGTPYGDPNRPGGQHVSQDGWGAMPAFGESLTPEQILAVARYEREVLDDARPPEGDVAAEGAQGGTAATEGAESGADDPTNEAETQGGDAGQSTSSEDDSGGSGETQGAEEGSTDVDSGNEPDDGGPEGDGNVDPDASGE